MNREYNPERQNVYLHDLTRTLASTRRQQRLAFTSNSNPLSDRLT